MKFDILVFFENLSRKFKYHENLIKITCTLLDRLMYIYDYISLSSF